MQLLSNIQSTFNTLANGTIVTIGNFDGVHGGHKAIISALREMAQKFKLPLIVILFEPQPLEFFLKDKAPPRISSLREKIKVLHECGVDYVYCLKFNHELSRQSALSFARETIFLKLKVKYLMVGQDFRFGYNREGDLDLFRQQAKHFGAQIIEFPEVRMDGVRISSTMIRHALAQGDLVMASKLLDRTYSLCGRVQRGDGRGRTLGFPTANLDCNRRRIPLKGVFVVRVKRQDGTWYNAVANIGNRPTIDGVKNVLEIHLFEFNESLYGERLEVFFLHKLREEVKFASVDSLVAQIHQDVMAAVAYFNE